MKITIAERLRPFSHTPGACCLIPGTWWQFQAFPTLLRFSHGSNKIEVVLELTGPVKDFTMQQDLERGALLIFGKAQEGYFRLRVEANDEGFLLFAEKTPPLGLATSKGVLAPKGQLHFPTELTFSHPVSSERISFGLHKSQNWDPILVRSDLKELIPHLLFLAQKTPQTPPHVSLLPEKKWPKNEIEKFLSSLFQAHFKQILVPCWIDDQHLGIPLLQADLSSERCLLIHQIAGWVRSLFFIQNERRLGILPSLPPSFDCGRFIGIECSGMGLLDFEWSKSQLRKLLIRAKTSGEILFDLPQEVTTFRVRNSRVDRGRIQKKEEPLLIEAGSSYFLDHFQK